MSDSESSLRIAGSRRFFVTDKNGVEIEEFGWGEEEEEPPPPFGAEDVKIEVTIRFTTGTETIDEQSTILDLPGLLSPSQLESSQAKVAEAIGTQVVEPIRACLRAELFSRAKRLPEAWLENGLELVDWYDTIQRVSSRNQRVDDKLQWNRIACGEHSILDLLDRAAKNF